MWSPVPVGGSLLTAVLLCLSAVPLTGKDCGSPGDILNGRFNLSQGTAFGAVVYAICNEGFEIVGSAYRQCYADGWSGRVLVCQVVKCDEPPEIQNGRIIARPSKGLPVYQDIIQYECDKDYYILNGKSTISCNSRGEYEPAPPVCEGFISEKLCVPPGQVENGRIVFSKGVEYGSTATVTCNEGYKVVGIKSVYCSFDGWSNQLGTCEAPCPRPDAQENVVLIREDLLKNEFRDGTTATFECVAGYVRSTGVPTITCTGGKWTELSLKCQKKSCGSPGDPQNGRFDLSQGTEVGAVAKLICNYGFTAVGPGLIHCSDEGWSGQPTCEEIPLQRTYTTPLIVAVVGVLVAACIFFSYYYWQKKNSVYYTREEDQKPVGVLCVQHCQPPPVYPC